MSVATSESLDDLVERRILPKLAGVEKTKGGLSARCPAHSDHRASLSVSVGDKGVVLHCHAGCQAESILSAIGLTMADLFPKANGKPHAQKAKQVAWYDYCDSTGTLRLQVARYEPKDFRQRQPKPDGEWSWSAKGVPALPYQLPRLLAEPTRPVVVVEGERDVITLTNRGLLATCNAGGAGKWTAEHAKYLAGRQVIVIPDNDDPGRQHAKQVARTLYGVATSIRIVELKGLSPKGDASDWFAAGHTKAELAELARATPLWTPTEPAATDAQPGEDGDGEELDADDPITNAAKLAGPDGTAETKPIPITEIVDQVQEVTGGWPRRVNNALFVDSGGAILWLENQSATFAYLHGVRPVVWRKGPGCVEKAELHHRLQQTATRYDAVDTLPHFPPIAGHYYAHAEITPGDGSCLDALLARFSPATTIDGDLLLAMWATPFWGGPPGARPGFVLTSQFGRGTGKTTAVKMLGRLAGGVFDVSLGEDATDIKKRLLTAEAAAKRIALIDNIKTHKMSSGDTEGLITAAEISGHQMYRGERVRPNDLTWLLTINGPALSKDMAQRCVIIQLDKPAFSPTWEEDCLAFIDANRWRIIADIAAFFCGAAVDLAKCSRFGAWERAVLARLPKPEDAQRVIAERQAEVDADEEMASHLEDAFRQRLEKLGYDSDADWVHIPADIARRWIADAAGEAVSAQAANRIVKQGAHDGTLKHLRPNPCRTYGRGMLWAGCVQRRDVLYNFMERELVRRAVSKAAGGGNGDEYWDR